MSQAAESISTHFSHTVANYGKVGVLVDDSFQAESRVARALYGLEKLPDWWLIARSVACGSTLLNCLDRSLSKGGAALASVVIIDRYLPLDCHELAAHVVAWDGPLQDVDGLQKKNCHELMRIVRSLLTRGDLRRHDSPRLHMELETSYPHAYWDFWRDFVRDPLPWKARAIDLLDELRRKILGRGDDVLLQFGPIQNIQNIATNSPKTDVDGWRSRFWWPAIGKLAGAFGDAKQFTILLTGAGASLQMTPVSRGMPSTTKLLRKACHDVMTTEHDPRRPNEFARDLDNLSCACTSRDESSDDEGKIRWMEGSETPIEWLLTEYSNDPYLASIDARLEELFSIKINMKDDRTKRLYQLFRDAFRVAMHRFDNGFIYHHWLIAQLPWSWIVTTNFDGYHERAAATAASVDQESIKRIGILRLGNELPLSKYPLEKVRSMVGKLEEERRLLKPYGSLLLPGLNLAFEEIEECQKRLRKAVVAIRDLIRKGGYTGGWLVVVGYSMVDRFMNNLINEVCRNDAVGRSMNILWVDPNAWHRCKRANEHHRFKPEWRWDELMGRLWNEETVGPLPARAHEFFYDLWHSFGGGPENRAESGEK